MVNKLTLEIVIPPSINNDYMKPRAIMSGGRPMAMLYESKVAKDFKKKMVLEINSAIESQGFSCHKGKYTRIDWTWYFARVNQDTNNYYKCAIDAITECGLVWEDDNISLNHDKRIYYDSKNPRVILEVYYENWIGIFDGADELHDFMENNCILCTRGVKGNCSIYKKAIANKIQEEIDMNIDPKVCSKLKLKK